MKRTIFTIITAACLALVAMAQQPAPAGTTTSTAPVGSIPGTSGVSPTGAATYTIPIAVPTGINGMQPQISIMYNSQGGYGALGRGWDVIAGSAITRVPRNQFNDGVNDRILSYSNTDVLMLDGQRLILLSGNNLEKDAVYGFEIENDTRIVIKPGLYYTTFKDDFYFEVTTKEGNVSSYGKNGDAKTIFTQINLNGIILTATPKMPSWRLSETSNVNGQTIQFSYIENGTYPSSIKYKGGIISFNYQDNPNTPPSSPKNPNVSGVISMSKLLQNITVAYSADGTSTGVTQRTYNFSYISDKLSSIGLTAADGTIMNSTSVSWNSPNSGIDRIRTSLTQPLEKHPLYPQRNNLNTKGGIAVLMEDVNDDGYKDIIERHHLAMDYLVIRLFNNQTGTYDLLDCISTSLIPMNDVGELSIFDVDNDGKNEIIIVNEKKAYTYRLHSKSTSLTDCSLDLISTATNALEGFGKGSIVQVVNVNNDEFNDLLTVSLFNNTENDKWEKNSSVFYGSKNGLQNASALTTSKDNINPKLVQYGDYNADGKIDILTLDSKGSDISKYNGIGFSHYNTTKWGDNYSTCISADFNSDGLTDMLVQYKGSYEWAILYNNGNSSITPRSVAQNNITKASNVFYKDIFGTEWLQGRYIAIPIDYDGDGKLELIVGDEIWEHGAVPLIGLPKALFQNTKWSCYKLVGDIFVFDKEFVRNEVLPLLMPNVADINHDGVNDLVLFLNELNGYETSSFLDGYYVDAFSSIGADRNNLLHSITNGMGLTTTFNYKNFDNYDKITTSGYIRNTNTPITIVDNVNELDGSTTEYDFQKPKVHNSGKGFLGFTEMTVRNKLANRKTVTSSEITQYNFLSLPFQRKVQQSVFTYDNKPISSSVQEFKSKPVIIGSNGITYYILPDNQTSTDHLTGISSTTTYKTYNYDACPTTITTTIGNITTTITTIYKSRITDGPEYLPKSVITKTVEGGLSHDQKKTYEYDTNQKGQVIKETTDPDDINKLVTTYSNFDAWGMPQTTTMTGKENGVDVSRSSHKRRTTSGRFIQSETNAIGQFTTYNWDETTGLLLDKTEYLDKKTTYAYDSWGRLLSSTNTKTGVTVTNTTNNLIGSKYLTQGEIDNCKKLGAAQFVYECLFLTAQEKKQQYDQNLIDAKESKIPYYSVVTTTDQNSKTVAAPVTVWYDIYGREMKRMTYGLDATSPIYQFTEYTADGKLYRTSAPTYSTKAESWDKTYTYDDYGRVLTITTPAGKETHNYGSTTNLKKTYVVGIDGMVTISEINDAGQTISAERYYAGPLTTHKKVTYTYYPSGLVHTTTPDGGATVIMEYDLQGRRTKLTDPDAGETTTEYSAFGDVTSESRKKGTKTITTRYYYLANGLLDKKQINNDLMQEYKYYYDGNIKGRLKIINKCAQHNRHFYYDDANKNYDRVVKIDETVGVKTYTTSYTHDSYGRQLTETFPTGYATTNHYNDYGMLFKITDNKNRTVWEATAENVRGQLKSVNKNGITQTFDYDAAGRTTSINTTKSTPNPGYSPTIDWLVKMEYGYTTDGNLDFRKEFRDGNSQEYQRENFGYDEFNRLTSWAITKINASTPALTHSITYDPTTGNITNKSDVGSMNMLYDNTSAPHRLTKIDGVPASVSSLTLDISYTDFDKVKKITRASDFPGPNKRKDYDITYGVDDQRITSTYSSGLYKKISTTYLGNYEVEEDSLGNIKKTHYLQGAIYIQTVKADGTTSEQFYSTISDFQGSLIALVDEHGTVAERYAFDPWGARRNPDDWTQTDARTSWITHRGYTGHEHIDVFGVINMNGRVYDPMTAAFFSPDPFVQSAGDWMNYNRYTYCMNNPFRYTDPSGNFWEYLVSMIVMTGFNYLNAVAQNNWDFKNTPLTNVQIGYGSNYGVYGGVSFDNGMSYANVGSGFNGATLGFTYAGNTSMQYIPTYAIPNSVAKAEANAREKYLFARGLEATGGIPDYYGSGDAQSQLEFTWSRPDLVPSSGGGNTLNAVGTGVGLLGLSSDIAKESGYVTTIGTNLKPYASGWAGNQFVKTVGIAKGVGTVTFVAGSFIDGALYFMKNPETGQPYQSGAKTLTNIGVSGTAMYLGGIPGIILGGGYMLIDKTVGWDRVMTPASNDQWVPNRAVFPDGTTIYVCFKAGTQIFAKGGSKSIEHIVVGDSVYSYNLEKNIVELSKVVKSFERKTQEIYELTTDNQKIYVTAEHPFYVVGNGWVKVKDLKAGAVLKTKDGSIEHVTSSVLEKHPETVYNIEVEGNHNYFVTNSNILVHNK